MKVRLKLNPGDQGTKKLHALYGDKLLCVRHRYDAGQERRYKTVDIVVEESPREAPRAFRCARRWTRRRTGRVLRKGSPAASTQCRRQMGAHTEALASTS